MSPEPPSSSPDTRTFICTVVFVDLVDYSRQPNTQQAALKKHLNEIIGRSLAHVVESERLALDTGDGAALCFFGDPEDALFAAAHLRDAITADPGPAGAQVRIGINLGPGRLIRDLNGNRNVIGDGVNVAQRVMSFATPNQILVSRSFYEVVSHISQEYARLFQYVGIHKDKHIREHEVYEVYVGGVAGAPPAEGSGTEEGSGTTEEICEEAPSGAGPPAAEFSPELLARLTEALVGHLGPVAKLVVRRASLRALDTRQLLAALADNLPGAARAKFLVQASEGMAPQGSPAGQPTGRTLDSPERRGVSGPMTPTMLARAEEHLARHLGPIARILVAQAAGDAADIEQLAERLAAHITDPAARKTFLASMLDAS